MKPWVPLLLLVLPLAAGCAHSHGSMMELVDAGIAHELAARELERGKDYPPAAERFAQSHDALLGGLEIAKIRDNQVFTSFITTKLSIVSSGEARCVEPKNDPQGSWERARSLYARAGEYADAIAMLKLKANSLRDRARCTQPDHDPAGSWVQAAALYAKAAETCEGLEDDEGRAEVLRLQALCLLQGDRSAPLTAEAKSLLTVARKLGDEEAAELLTASGAAPTFCNACGADRRPEDRFCRQCGRDQSAPPPGEKPQGEGRSPQRAPGAPGMPGGPEGGGPGGGGPR